MCTYPCFPGILFINTPHNILTKPLAAFQHNNCRMDSSERGMNPVAMAIINPQKDHWPSKCLQFGQAPNFVIW